MDIRFVIYVAGFFWVLLIPCIIVALWRARPRLALFAAALIMLLSLLTVQFYRGYLGFELFGYSERRMRLFVEETVMFCILGMIMFTPVLILFQKLILRVIKTPEDTRDIFR